VTCGTAAPASRKCERKQRFVVDGAKLTFCRRWIPDFHLGSLLALLLPLSIAFFLGGAALTEIWVALEIPVGPRAAVSYALPAPVRR